MTYEHHFSLPFINDAPTFSEASALSFCIYLYEVALFFSKKKDAQFGAFVSFRTYARLRQLSETAFGPHNLK